jgi:galactokinase
MNTLNDLALKVLRCEPTTAEDFPPGLSQTENVSRREREWALLGDIMNQQQILLRDLYDVSLPKIEEICSAALTAGAYGAKISGSGMGGSVIALVKNQEVGRKVLDACRSVGAKDGWVSGVSEGADAGPVKTNT